MHAELGRINVGLGKNNTLKVCNVTFFTFQVTLCFLPQYLGLVGLLIQTNQGKQIEDRWNTKSVQMNLKPHVPLIQA